MQQTEYVIEGLCRFSPAQGRLCLVASSETREAGTKLCKWFILSCFPCVLPMT